MEFSKPKPFHFEGNGKRAVLLLHSFTGSTIDMRKLGRYIAKQGYDAFAPMYTGHGESAFELLKYGPEQWWADVLTAYEHLESEGFEEIAVVGLSLGSILALKVATDLSPIGLVTMSTPMKRDEIMLRKRVVYYAKNHMKYESLTQEEKDQKLQMIKAHDMESVKQFVSFIDTQMTKLSSVTAPLLMLVGGQDEPLYKESASYILQRVQSQHKSSKEILRAGHLMTYGEESEYVNETILTFLNELPWANKIVTF